MWSEYPSISGTVIGETRNEIYNRYGEATVEATRYGWHHELIDDLTQKVYNLVPVEPVQYLITTTAYYPFITKAYNQFSNMPPVPDLNRPNTIHLEWVLASASTVPYNL